MIKIRKTGIVADVSPYERADLTRQFSENHYLRFPNLLSEDILQDFTQQFRSDSWVERIHKGIGVEVCLNDPSLIGLMNFLLNDQRLFGLIQELTDCGRIGCFEGRFYRMLPEAGHYDSWHTDFSGHRLVALSVNLSQEPYTGGTLQLRHQNEKEWFAELPNTGYGDAILFRIAPHLEHRVTPVISGSPKTAFAGWFKDQPDFWSSLITAKGAGPTDIQS